jgi:hypothetical protein
VSAPKPKVTLTPEVHAYFTAYLKKNPAWGIYHVFLDDGNYGDVPEEPYAGGWDQDYATPCTDEDRRMWALFRQMTPSQQRRIAKKNSALFYGEPADPVHASFRVATIDHETGVVTLERDD